jgi:TM2 domain-containing membrane protein YozV
MSESAPSIPPPPPIPALPPPTAGRPTQSGLKNPWVALALSFLFPGVGQVYNGQPAKALVFLLGFAGAIYGAVEIGPLPFAFLIPFVYLFNLVDAYRSAVLGVRGQASLDEVAESPAWGGTLIGLGAVLLLHNLGWLNLRAVARFWPLLLIVAGLAFLRGAIQRRKDAERLG